MPDFTLADLARSFPEGAGNLPLPRHLRTQLEATFETDQARVLAKRTAQMPVLTNVSNSLGDRPLEGVRVVMVLHFLRDLTYFIGSCQDAGLSPERTLLLYKPYPYVEKEWVKTCLTKWGYRVAPVEDLSAILPDFLAEGQEDILIIEDGGYVVPFLHRSMPDMLARVLGAVEQTMRGLWNDEAILADPGGLRIPVISIAESDIKRDFEPAGVADALWTNIQQLTPDTLLTGSTVLIVGYGTIGRALARRAHRMPVLVYDLNVYRRALARHEGHETVNTLAEGLGRANVRLVIGTSGKQSIDPEHIGLARHGVYLASASSDRVEIAVDYLEQQCSCSEVSEGCKSFTFSDGRTIYLLAEGYPVNFYAADSVQNQLIDIVMSQIFLAACLLARERRVLPPEFHKDTVNALSRNAELIETFYRTHWG